MYRYDVENLLKKYVDSDVLCHCPKVYELIESISYNLSTNDLTLILKQLNIRED